jgi:hypothetical protein
MDEPVQRRLRPARRSGLTSPDPVRTPTAVTATRTLTPAQESRTSRRTGQRQNTLARIHPGKRLVKETGRKGLTGMGRWIEAKRDIRQLWYG